MLDSTAIKSIITTFGISGSTAEGFASLGIKGIFYAILFFAIRFLVQKFLWHKVTKWVSNLNESKDQYLEIVEKHTKALETLIVKADVQASLLKDSIETNNKSFEITRDTLFQCHNILETQQNNISILLEDASGELDKRLVVNVAGNYFEKINYRIEAFFKLRLEQNHIKDNEITIYNKYLAYAQRLAPKLEMQFSLFTHNGRNLVDFFGYGGAYLYVSTILTDLFDLQKTTMLGGDNNIIQAVEVGKHLEHIVSYMIVCISNYCDKGVTFVEYYDSNPFPKTIVNNEMKEVI